MHTILSKSFKCSYLIFKLCAKLIDNVLFRFRSHIRHSLNYSILQFGVIPLKDKNTEMQKKRLNVRCFHYFNERFFKTYIHVTFTGTNGHVIISTLYRSNFLDIFYVSFTVQNGVSTLPN